jgi:hypothetical protein
LGAKESRRAGETFLFYRKILRKGLNLRVLFKEHSERSDSNASLLFRGNNKDSNKEVDVEHFYLALRVAQDFYKDTFDNG